MASLLFLSWGVQALEDDFNKQIIVDADRQQVNIKENRVTFYSNVIVTQGSIKMHAAELSVIGSEDKGSEVMIAKGEPATFYQLLDSGKPIEAEANEVRYDLKTQTLTLTQNAQLKQEESLVKGQMIKYSIDKQEMVAQGDENSRVTTIFLPKQLEEISPKSKPQE
ncbi:lipopolysaccharide transport periplasmic protein LptA [Agarivorans sp. MS3-6]|uniref:lipopolysaccharide transport periplasmic protein LptA n=1 Tax=Agarivorans sp. TSD2052 TaxID=2937286 RepID=UPI0020109D3A|nr:lipopolysaccharide transport periplasmic protein LptA [Agarivorans sp. TSD2052]UPW17976.1 lipopolysaccharide transport periplasmic protein LptA [Agarivorans sp. TSD2052]